jgi:hypothetical protein
MHTRGSYAAPKVRHTMWWTDEQVVRRKAQQRVGWQLPDPVWARVWDDYAQDFREVDDEARAERVFEQLVERVEELVAFASVWHEVPTPVPVHPRRRGGEPEPVTWDGRRLHARLERAVWHLEHDRDVRRARALLGEGKLSLAQALSVLQSPVLAWISRKQWERLGIPPVHQARLAAVEQREMFKEEYRAKWITLGSPPDVADELARDHLCRMDVYEVTWPGGSRLVTLPTVAGEQLETLAEKVWFPLAPDGEQGMSLSLRPAMRDSPLALLYKAARKVETLAFLSKGWAVAWVLCRVPLVSERLV